VIEAAIVGAAETQYTRQPQGRPTLELLAEAACLALVDSGLAPHGVDGLAVASFSLAPDHAVDLAWRLGLRLRWLMDDANGGASGINMLQHALRAVEAGDADTVLILAGDGLGTVAFRRLVETYNSATRDHLAPLPTGGPNALFALLTQRHMQRHGLGREAYGKVAIMQREWAALNPGAVYRKPLSLEEYLEAPIVAEPLGRLDCVPIVSGADALIVSRADRAADRAPIRVPALRTSFNADDQEGDGLQTGIAQLVDRLWADAGATPDDVDVVAVYDDYPVMVLVQLADLGLVDGDLGRFVDEQLATRRLPVNTSGGQLSAGQAGAAGGLHGFVEAVRQLRGEAGERQVPDARRAVVAAYGMVAYRHGACAGAAVLERAA
jgi:acetyl-CoA acetyltransferase